MPTLVEGHHVGFVNGALPPLGFSAAILILMQCICLFVHLLQGHMTSFLIDSPIGSAWKTNLN